MKKIILLSVCFVLMLTGVAFAIEACVVVQRAGHWMGAWDQAKIDSLTADELDEYNSRLQPLDIVAVYKAIRCPVDTGEGADRLAVIITDLDPAIAKKYRRTMQEDTGEVDEEGNPISKIKWIRNYQINWSALTAAEKTAIQTKNYVTTDWVTFRSKVKNKDTGEGQ